MAQPKTDDFVGRHLINKRIANFQINDNWEVLVDGRAIGELDSVNFDEL